MQIFTNNCNFSQRVQKKDDRRGYNKAPAPKKEARPVRRQRSAKDKKTVKQLLGELYADRDYLERLLEETGKDK